MRAMQTFGVVVWLLGLVSIAAGPAETAILLNTGIPQDEEAAVIVAAVTAVRPEAGGGAAGIDASRLCSAALARWRCPEPIERALARLDVTPTTREFTYVCPENGEGCHLVGVRHLLIPGVPQVRGGSAQVAIEIVSDRGDGSPTVRRFDVHLVRNQDAWSVVRVDGN